MNPKFLSMTTALFIVASVFFAAPIAAQEKQSPRRTESQRTPKIETSNAENRRRTFGYQPKTKIDQEELRKRAEKKREEIKKVRKELSLGHAGRGVDVEAGYEAAGD